MHRYGRGDAAAFETLYARHRTPLYRYLLRQCRSRMVTEELFQDVWLRLIHAPERYDVPARFIACLYTIAHKRVADHFRRAAAGHVQKHDGDGRVLDALAADPAEHPADGLAPTGQAAKLLTALDRLPAEEREVFLLREETGMSVDAIARITDLPVETARSRLRDAVSKLQRALGEARQEGSFP